MPPDRKLDYVYIRSIYVLPTWRKNKIASNFVDGLISNCKKVGINTIEVEPFDESMFFWNKYGFIEIENKVTAGVKRLALNF
jgi:N-acetylglutamate synthase-like GNAT family acetyltransferase